MKLYHGTAERFAQNIINNGLRPRWSKEGNWEIESRNDCVYLTTCYAPFFAANASSDEEKWLMVEVDTDDLDPKMVLPDEDWLEQISRHQEDLECHGWPMDERTKWFRENLEKFDHHWQGSLDGLGNCCHFGSIEPRQIKRVSLFDWDAHHQLAWTALDPMISTLNFRFCADKYYELTAQVMDLSETLYENRITRVPSKGERDDRKSDQEKGHQEKGHQETNHQKEGNPS